MLPGKKYRPEDFLFILRRRFWLLIVPFAVVSAGTAAVARKLPDRYRSDTLILVVPQRVPEAYVKSTVNTPIQERLQALSQTILSRTRLERVIQDFNLYADERRVGLMEDVIARMRRDITTQTIRGDAFRITYTGQVPLTVMKVAERLGALFIDESMRDRELLAEGTNQFLEAQLEDAKRRLLEQEKKVEEYRRRFAGELPTQLGSNMQAIQNIQMQLQAIVTSLNTDQQRRLTLERQLLAETETPVDPSPRVEAGTSFSESPVMAPTRGTAGQQLAQARAALVTPPLSRLKDGHPDRETVKRLVRDLERKAEAEALEAPVSASVATNLPAAERARQKRITDLRADIEQLDRQMAAKTADEQRLRGLGAVYQQKADKAPTRETEMVELTRDYSTLERLYVTLLQKREDSKISANLERRQIGEQFKLLDQARLPEKPISPDRQLINVLGMLSGLGVGIGLLVLVEYRDRSFKTDDEITGLLSLPVLAVVPLMQSHEERRRGFKRRLILNLGLGSAVLGCLAVLAYTFVFMR